MPATRASCPTTRRQTSSEDAGTNWSLQKAALTAGTTNYARCRSSRTRYAQAISGSTARASSRTSTSICCQPGSSTRSSSPRNLRWIDTECESYLHAQLSLLEQQLGSVDRMAAANDLPDAILTDSGLK